MHSGLIKTIVRRKLTVDYNMAALPAPVSNEDRLKEYDSVPLFMRSLPEPGELADDTAISALQALVHEGTPDGK